MNGGTDRGHASGGVQCVFLFTNAHLEIIAHGQRGFIAIVVHQLHHAAAIAHETVVTSSPACIHMSFIQRHSQSRGIIAAIQGQLTTVLNRSANTGRHIICRGKAACTGSAQSSITQSRCGTQRHSGIIQGKRPRSSAGATDIQGTLQGHTTLQVGIHRAVIADYHSIFNTALHRIAGGNINLTTLGIHGEVLLIHGQSAGILAHIHYGGVTGLLPNLVEGYIMTLRVHVVSRVVAGIGSNGNILTLNDGVVAVLGKRIGQLINLDRGTRFEGYLGIRLLADKQVHRLLRSKTICSLLSSQTKKHTLRFPDLFQFVTCCAELTFQGQVATVLNGTGKFSCC